MTINEAIEYLELNKAMITYNPIAGEELKFEQLNEDNQKIYNALEIAIKTLLEKKIRAKYEELMDYLVEMERNKHD